MVYAPVISLRQISLSPEDVQDLRNVQPFVLTTPEIPSYDIQYLGKEKIDDIGCYTFSVKPKKMVTGKRYFEGQIWVDDQDLQIVKTYGKGVGIVKGDQAFPKFETYREQIDKKYWFPMYTRATDTLHFKKAKTYDGMTVKYQTTRSTKAAPPSSSATWSMRQVDGTRQPRHPSRPDGKNSPYGHIAGDATPFALTTISCALLPVPAGRENSPGNTREPRRQPHELHFAGAPPSVTRTSAIAVAGGNTGPPAPSAAHSPPHPNLTHTGRRTVPPSGRAAVANV